MSLIKSLGFEDDLGPLGHPRMESGAGYPLDRRSDGAGVDLHYTLFGIGVEPEDLWDAFSETAVREPVGGSRSPSPPVPRASYTSPCTSSNMAARTGRSRCAISTARSPRRPRRSGPRQSSWPSA